MVLLEGGETERIKNPSFLHQREPFGLIRGRARDSYSSQGGRYCVSADDDDLHPFHIQLFRLDLLYKYTKLGRIGQGRSVQNMATNFREGDHLYYFAYFHSLASGSVLIPIGG